MTGSGCTVCASISFFCPFSAKNGCWKLFEKGIVADVCHSDRHFVSILRMKLSGMGFVHK